MQQNRLEPVARHPGFIPVKRLEWRGTDPGRERHHDGLECRLMVYDVANACREFVREEEALLLRCRVVQGGYRCYGSDVNGADFVEAL